jgi:RNA polymerase-binding transcription factor DksA
MSHEAVAKQLTERLQALESRVVKIEGDLRQPLDSNAEDQAIELEDLDALPGIENAALSEIEQIRQALARIANGTYGTCAKCGGPIPAKRLEAMPTATECVACAE